MSKVVVFTCAIGNHDWIHRPKVKPPGVDFLRFSDSRPLLLRGWRHRSLAQGSQLLSPRLLSRLPKIRPHIMVPEYEIAIWVDSSVEILGDIMPLVRAFCDKEYDIAFFPHPSGRSVSEEIDYAISNGRITPNFHQRAELQRRRYEVEDILQHKINECTILFYRVQSSRLQAACESWWQELSTYTERDQISQPFAMRDRWLSILSWDWHFDNPNPFFRRLPHRPKKMVTRLKTGAHFLGDDRLDYRVVRNGIRAAGAVRRAGQALFPRF